jgi:hypothetical protein
MFSGRQTGQDVKVLWQGVAGGLVEPKLISFGQFWFSQATSNTLKVGMEAVPVT